MRILRLRWYWGLSLVTAALPKLLLSSVFQLSFTPHRILSEAEIGILEAATRSVLRDAVQQRDNEYLANQTQVIFDLPDQTHTIRFQASTVSIAKNREEWQGFVAETLANAEDLVFQSVRSELGLTSLSISSDKVSRERIFTRLDWILLAISIVLFGIFIYVMSLNYRDWKNDQPPRDIEEMTEYPVHKPTPEPQPDESKELSEIMERFTVASDANTSPTSSTKERPSAPYRCADQDACSLEAALSGLSDLVHNVMRPEPSLDGTMPSNATSDVFDTIDDSLPGHHRAAEWMKHVRISVLDSSSSLASRDSLKHAMVDATSTVNSETS